ncbi:DoxX family protein [Bizionia saleffrena]|uniref:DoxX family protein n=1 Tax=Bizionia saleffrena TaxID=291189 RepID=A0A8H2LCW0_9FLAO|nr:DoxX family protein [Bizionia saleffrena]TYB74484.1 DoxX family protein [Bizionia saleffrena]
MNYLVIAFQVIVGISLLNVWLLQSKKATRWRGGNATTIMEEFKVYGLSATVCYIVGFIKVTLAILLIVAIWYPVLKQPAALGLAALLLGSVAMHLKIKDPLFKSFPAALFLIMCLFIAFF